MMSFNKNTQFNRGRKPKKRVLIGETQEEAARLEKEIAGHPVTRCKPGPFLLAPRLEQQAVHSSLGADYRRGDREEDDAEPKTKS